MGSTFVDVMTTTRVGLVVKDNTLRDALANFVVKSRGLFYSFVEAQEFGVIGQFHIVISVPDEALAATRSILNEWMVSDVNCEGPNGYPNGSLLFYSATRESDSRPWIEMH